MNLSVVMDIIRIFYEDICGLGIDLIRAGKPLLKNNLFCIKNIHLHEYSNQLVLILVHEVLSTIAYINKDPANTAIA